MSDITVSGNNVNIGLTPIAGEIAFDGDNIDEAGIVVSGSNVNITMQESSIRLGGDVNIGMVVEESSNDLYPYSAFTRLSFTSGYVPAPEIYDRDENTYAEVALPIGGYYCEISAQFNTLSLVGLGYTSVEFHILISVTGEWATTYKALSSIGIQPFSRPSVTKQWVVAPGYILDLSAGNANILFLNQSTPIALKIYEIFARFS